MIAFRLKGNTQELNLLQYQQPAGSRILLALDGLSLRRARKIGKELSTHVGGGKANDLIDEVGARALDGMGFGINFLDPKINDIRNTVVNRIQKYRNHADMITVHASMDENALIDAANTATSIGVVCIAVTILTSIDDTECISIFGDTAAKKVAQFANIARVAGVHGIVCSPKETKIVRDAFPRAIIINPGVRSKNENAHDQQRIDTPANAILNGANYVVVGRQVLDKKTPALRLAAVQRINYEIADALGALKNT